jgi:hypothetical protein
MINLAITLVAVEMEQQQNKLLRRGETKLFKRAEPCINSLLLLSQSPFDNMA